jgi:hypothetical protein
MEGLYILTVTVLQNCMSCNMFDFPIDFSYLRKNLLVRFVCRILLQ